MWHRLYFLPLPQGHVSLRPIFATSPIRARSSDLSGVLLRVQLVVLATDLHDRGPRSELGTLSIESSSSRLVGSPW
jgi:hypothetical protein